ncbi:MAG: protein tyrosine phosphatase [Frankiales bacterium]|jgi:protein-tyrosine phosphatase|nr:protein tyrosine phosphatase [Frankiales bacterium]
MPRVTWIELEGAANVRDVGGLPTVDGRTTRRGVLLRADNLQGLTPRDVEELTGARRLRTVLDLRSTGEVHLEGPGPLRATDVAHHHLTLIPETEGEPDQVEVERAIPSRAHRAGETPNDMTGFYVGYLEDAPDKVAEALRLIADPASGATLVHCAAGKDRTGVVVAVALSLVGVTREAVVQDYVKSAERIEAILARLQASPTYGGDLAERLVDDMRPVAGSMERFLDHVDRAYGGPHGLALSLGVDEETLERLGRRLVGPSPHAAAAL